MLKSIDILIGISLVMLLASLVVTALTEFVTNLWNSRGRHLLQGIADLLQQIDPNLERALATKIAAAVLTHPLIRDVAGRYGTVIQREELTKILLELAADDGPQKLDDTVRQRLAQALSKNGISHPDQVIQRVRELILQLELSRPDLATHVRHSIALLEEAQSAFVAKVNGWFDQTMDRVSARFTLTTRGVTLVIGLLLAFAVQLDTPLLVNRLATDPQLRASMIQQAAALDAQQHAWDQMTAEQRRQAFDKLANANLVTIPSDFAEWWSNWSGPGAHPTVLGAVLTAILLSFGAPFWYNALKNLLRLRSTLAQKETDQAEQRTAGQGSQVSAATVERTVAAAIGERGDLRAFG